MASAADAAAMPEVEGMSNGWEVEGEGEGTPRLLAAAGPVEGPPRGLGAMGAGAMGAGDCCLEKGVEKEGCDADARVAPRDGGCDIGARIAEPLDDRRDDSQQ